MPKSKSDYWAQREADERSWINNNLTEDAEFNRVLQQYYDEMLVEIQRDIDSEYQKYAGYSGTTMKQAIQAVSDEDVRAFQNKAAQIVAEARRLEKEKGRALKSSDFTQEVNDQLKLYNATMRINRLEMLKSKIGLELTQANMNIQADLFQKLEQEYQAEIKRQAGILGETIPLTSIKETIEIVNAQIDGATFSQRIWANQAALKSQLDSILIQAMIRGESPAVLARKLKDLVNQAVNNRRYVTERLARTEMARAQDKAQMNSFSKYGYDYCKWIAEPSACRICRDIASQNDGIYKTNDVPDIPVHANCRCSKAAWYEKSDDQ